MPFRRKINDGKTAEGETYTRRAVMEDAGIIRTAMGKTCAHALQNFERMVLLFRLPEACDSTHGEITYSVAIKSAVQCARGAVYIIIGDTRILHAMRYGYQDTFVIMVIAARILMTVVDYINALRTEEISRVLKRHGDLFRTKDLLEIGSGTGAQLQLLAGVCKSAVGIEVAGSQYSPHSLVEIQQYDGRHIPFPDASFDIVFSSNVIEHVRDEETIHGEMHRVLRPGGIAVHVLPTHHWRLWTSIVHYPNLVKKLASRLHLSDKLGGTEAISIRSNKSLSRRLSNILVSEHHGEFGNRFTEYYHFHPGSWRRRFEKHGWSVETVEPLGLAYEGNCFLAERVSLETRAFLARLLGSASVLLIMRSRLQT